ncbi:MAG: SprT-like domain-containing protein [Nostocoides sp.]
MDTADALRLARELLGRHGLADWQVRLDRAKTRAGVCRYRERVIGLSGPMTRLHSPQEVRDTILHEIAHALAGPEHGHDEVWKATAASIGCSAQRCVPADVPRPVGTWRGVCPAGHVVTRHRRPARVQSCSRCSPGFSPAHLLSWTHHGEQVQMHPKYVAELTDLQRRYGSTLRLGPEVRGGVQVALDLGASARVVAPGPWQGAIGGSSQSRV